MKQLPIRAALVLALSLVSVIAKAEGGWITQNSGTLAWLHAVYFIDPNTGWVGGASGTLLSTLDGGKNWRKQPKPSEDSIHDLYFANAKDGWLLCEREVFKLKTNAEQSSYLLRTHDGGQTWRRIDIAGNVDHARLVGFIFTVNGTAWLYGEAGTLLKSVDGGENWRKQTIPTGFVLLAGDFLTQEQGWLIAAGFVLVRTADGGESWRPVQALDRRPGVRLSSAFFADPKFGWVVGTNGLVFATIDGGMNWQQQAVDVETDLRNVKFIDASEGWISGAEGIVLHTVDGGSHWQAEHTGTTHLLERLFVQKSHNIWAVGFGGTILSYDPNAEQPKIR